MAIKRMPIGDFVYGLTQAEARRDGYIMGAKGQSPKKLSSWYYNQYNSSSYTSAQKKKALYWKEHAVRVWDCNGLPEGLYEDFSGVNINTKARYNYKNWCTTKGTGTIPAEMRVPGAAVFIHSSSKGYITHVGYLERPVTEGKPEGDWYLIEARGVLYGVVRTKLIADKRGWNRWGLMEKYFDYEDVKREESRNTVTVTGGSVNVRTMASKNGMILTTVHKGEKYPYLGEAKDGWYKVSVDEFVGWISAKYTKLELGEEEKTDQLEVRVSGGSVCVRKEPKGKIITTVHRGDLFPYTGNSKDGWHEIRINGGAGWISGNLSEVIKA